MTKKRYTGCVYADPPDSTSVQNFMELSKQDLANMRLVGLPLKVEHTGPPRGEIVDQHTDDQTGYTTVTFEVFDDYAGDALCRMIANGKLPDLSLCHNLYASQDLPFDEWKKEPVEVSLCLQGARPGTHICSVECSNRNDEGKPTMLARIIKMSASQIGKEGDAISNAAPPPVVSEAPPSTQNVHVPQAESHPVTLSERPRDEQGRFLSAPVSDTAPPVPTTNNAGASGSIGKGGLGDIANRIERIAQGLDSKVSNELIDTVGDILMAHVQAHEKLKQVETDSQTLRTKCESLEKDNETMRAERKAEFGKMAGDIADALSDIYMQYNGSPMDQTSKKELISELDRNPKIAKTFQGLPMATVAMSAQRQAADMGNRVQQARVDNASEKENVLTKRLREYQSQLSALQSAGASPQYNASTATPSAETPTIEVSASQQKYGKTYNMLPPALRESIANYDVSCGSGRMTPDDYSGDILGKRQRA